MSSSEIDRDKELTEAIAALAEVFIGRIPTALESMEHELDSIIHDSRNHAAWTNLHRQLHSLAGSAGTFGHAELGNRARELEHRINSMLKTETAYVDPTKSAFMLDQRNFMLWAGTKYSKK